MAHVTSTAPRRAAGIAILALALPLVATAATATPSAAPTYRVYDMGFKGGEPGISYDPAHDATFYAAGTTVLKAHWDSAGNMAKSNVSPAFSPTTLDTILVTDQRTHRTFVSYLALACSFMSYTDDAAESWSTSSGCGAGAAVDHQAIGVGPLHAPLTAGPTGYKGAVYYCAQDSFNGQCSVSLDGGVTFAPAVPVANTPGNLVGDPYGGACSALHGHPRIGPDGTAYLPLKGCGGTPTLNNATNSEFFGGRPSLSVTENNGVSWEVRLGPVGSHNPDESDPSVAIGPKGTLYYGWEDGTNPSDAVGGTTSAAKVATSRDGGKTWSNLTDLSTPLGLHNVQFPEMITGDDDRAAFSFIATPGRGNDQDNSFRGVWHLYVATTTDSGKSWTTVDATPKDPVNKGCVHMLGLAPGSQRTDSCSYRNMLDFNDITVDKSGRVLVAYTDACGESCSAGDGWHADTNALKVVRTACGPGLRAQYDSVLRSGAGCAAARGTSRGLGGSTSGSGPGSGSGGGLPTTGAPAAVGILALLLLSGAAVLRRRPASGR